VTQPLPPNGFWSYARADDRNSGGQISRLREKLVSEIEILAGPRPPVELWQDTSDIPGGSVWSKQIATAISQASFFVAVVTPGFLHSKWCCEEVLRFRDRELELGRSDLIFPFIFAYTEDLDPDRSGDCHDPKVFKLLRERQVMNFYDLRYHDFDNWQVRERIGAFARTIRTALRRPALAATATPISISTQFNKPDPDSVLHDPTLAYVSLSEDERAGRRADEPLTTEAATQAEDTSKPDNTDPADNSVHGADPLHRTEKANRANAEDLLDETRTIPRSSTGAASPYGRDSRPEFAFVGLMGTILALMIIIVIVALFNAVGR
jgi:hypothetical protein